MVGQHPFLAPEMRRARNSQKPLAASIESDRFAWAVVMNCILLNRHPTQGLKLKTPAKFDNEMMSGKWPERKRRAAKGETPLAAIGDDIPSLFDRAFPNDPAASRPSAGDWRIALGKAVQNMLQHKCGHVFVAGGSEKCPWCNKPYVKPVQKFAPRPIE